MQKEKEFLHLFYSEYGFIPLAYVRYDTLDNLVKCHKNDLLKNDIFTVNISNICGVISLDGPSSNVK